MTVFTLALWAATLALGSAGPQDTAHDPFAYRIQMTPEEGPRDRAVEARYSADWKACQASRSATSDLAPCYDAEFKRQDAALNRAWTNTLRRLPRSRHTQLRRAQRAWIAARDPFCRHYVDGLRGSLVSVAYRDCRIELTIRRTAWLETL